MIPWKILIVDDEEGIHGITRMIFRDYEFEQRPIELISAMSSSEAQQRLEQDPDIALILLDVVMETENAGLQLVETIRHQMNNQDVRIILRTGHPGYAPEAQVIIDYDINDYLSKAELSASRLLTSVIVALRSYRDIQSAREQPAEVNKTAPHKDELLPELTRTLQKHLTPALKQSQRL
ncbi:response regulator, partial [Oceanospirillum sp. HFRX-1_2]